MALRAKNINRKLDKLLEIVPDPELGRTWLALWRWQDLRNEVTQFVPHTNFREEIVVLLICWKEGVRLSIDNSPDFRERVGYLWVCIDAATRTTGTQAEKNVLNDAVESATTDAGVYVLEALGFTDILAKQPPKGVPLVKLTEEYFVPRPPNGRIRTPISLKSEWGETRLPAEMNEWFQSVRVSAELLNPPAEVVPYSPAKSWEQTQLPDVLKWWLCSKVEPETETQEQANEQQLATDSSPLFDEKGSS